VVSLWCVVRSSFGRVGLFCCLIGVGWFIVVRDSCLVLSGLCWLLCWWLCILWVVVMLFGLLMVCWVRILGLICGCMSCLVWVMCLLLVV